MLFEQQIAERRERRRNAIARILEKPDGQSFGDYKVRSSSGKSYRVAMRGPGLFESFCSCPDFAVNTLGTCKHIESLLERLRERHGRALERRRLERVRASVPLCITATGCKCGCGCRLRPPRRRWRSPGSTSTRKACRGRSNTVSSTACWTSCAGWTIRPLCTATSSNSSTAKTRLPRARMASCWVIAGWISSLRNWSRFCRGARARRSCPSFPHAPARASTAPSRPSRPSLTGSRATSWLA